MGLNTKNVELADDMSSDTCKGCAALRADVEMHGQKVSSVKLQCELADIVAADYSAPFKRAQKIKAAARRVLGQAINPNAEYDCEALRNAAYDLKEIEESRENSHRKMRKILPPESQGVFETRGPRSYPPGQRPEGVWETRDGFAASRWVAAQGRKLKE